MAWLTWLQMSPLRSTGPPDLDGHLVPGTILVGTHQALLSRKGRVRDQRLAPHPVFDICYHNESRLKGPCFICIVRAAVEHGLCCFFSDQQPFRAPSQP